MRLTNILRTNIKDLPKNWANFPERYVKKQTQFIEWETPKLPNYQRKVTRWRKNAYHDMFDPWTLEFERQNGPRVYQPRIYVEPHKRFPVFKGDMVEVLTGKDKGKTGLVCLVVPERNWVCVERLNLSYRLQERGADNPGIVLAEAMPLLLNRDVRLIDPSDKQATVTEWRFDDEGNEVRVSTRTGRIIPLPTRALETYDFKVAEYYNEQPKDTKKADLQTVTFVPRVTTFEMDIMEQMGIKDDRIPHQMYWY